MLQTNIVVEPKTQSSNTPLSSLIKKFIYSGIQQKTQTTKSISEQKWNNNPPQKKIIIMLKNTNLEKFPYTSMVTHAFHLMEFLHCLRIEKKEKENISSTVSAVISNATLICTLSYMSYYIYITESST